MNNEIDVVVPAFNPGPNLVELINCLLAQEVSLPYTINVVDDGSTHWPLNPELYASEPRLNITRLQNNSGRARARNIGFLSGYAKYVAFLDSDCLPADHHFLRNHYETIQNGYDLSLGPVLVTQPAHAARLNKRIVRRREINIHDKTEFYTDFYSANFMVLRNLMEQTGGFCEEYERYGYEDKDLAIQLYRMNTKAGFTPAASVKHVDMDSGMQLYKKQYEAAKWSAPILYRRYPREIKALPHGAIDLQVYPRRRMVLSGLRLFLAVFRPVMARLYDAEGTPYLLWNISRLGLMIAGYLDGTRSRNDQDQSSGAKS